MFKQYTEFLGHSDSIFSSGELRSRVEKDLVGEACRGEIAAGQSYVWDNVALAIPAIPPSRLVGCGIINCTYIVKVTRRIIPIVVTLSPVPVSSR